MAPPSGTPHLSLSLDTQYLLYPYVFCPNPTFCSRSGVGVGCPITVGSKGECYCALIINPQNVVRSDAGFKPSGRLNPLKPSGGFKGGGMGQGPSLAMFNTQGYCNLSKWALQTVGDIFICINFSWFNARSQRCHRMICYHYLH